MMWAINMCLVNRRDKKNYSDCKKPSKEKLNWDVIECVSHKGFVKGKTLIMNNKSNSSNNALYVI